MDNRLNLDKRDEFAFEKKNEEAQQAISRWGRSGIFIVNFEHISHLVLVFLLVNFEHVITGWEFC